MALEEELMKAEQETAKEEAEETKNPDDLSDEEIEAVKELAIMPWWEVLKKCMEKRVKKQEEDLLVLAKEHFMEPKKLWYTAFEVLGGFIQWMWEMERLVKVLTTDPEEIKAAVEALQKAEQELTEWKKKRK